MSRLENVKFKQKVLKVRTTDYVFEFRIFRTLLFAVNSLFQIFTYRDGSKYNTKPWKHKIMVTLSKSLI